jgi:hypothetical protein
LVQELHKAGSNDAEAYAFCSVIPEATDDQGLTEAESNECKERALGRAITSQAWLLKQKMIILFRLDASAGALIMEEFLESLRKKKNDTQEQLCLLI